MTELRTVRIGEIGRIVTGKTPPTAQPELFGELHPFLTPTDIDGFARYFEPQRYLSPEGRDYQYRLMLPERAICVVCIGATIGKICITDRPSFTNQQINSIVVNEQQHDPFFVYYLLTTISDRLKANAGGAATPIINKTAFSELKVRVPPLAVQQRIARILSAYDELIENSQRHIRILEEMVRALYREWFIYFRLPGQKQLKCVTSPFGDIPLGWQSARLRDLTTKIGSGATPRGGKEAYHSEGIALIRSLNIYDYQFEFSKLAFIDDGQADQLDNVGVEQCDVLLNITGASVARCSMVPSYILPARVNQHVAIIRANPQRMSPYYLLDAINNDQNKQRLLGLAQGGATREALTKDTLSNFPILVPPRDLISRYGDVAGPLHTQREILNRKTQNLRRTRELLLPCLLSGQVNLETD
jgi:type I restriction enzyme S subunit